MARILYVMLRDRVPYRDPRTNHEALLVDRNTPCWLRQFDRFGILQPTCDGTLRVKKLECSGRGDATKLTAALRISLQRYADRLSPGVDSRRACLQTRATMHRNPINQACVRSPP